MTTQQIAAAKFGVKLMTGISVGTVVGHAVSHVANPQSTFDSVKIFCGSFVLGSIVSEVAVNHVDAKMTQLENWYNNRSDDTEATA